MRIYIVTEKNEFIFVYLYTISLEAGFPILSKRSAVKIEISKFSLYRIFNLLSYYLIYMYMVLYGEMWPRK
jgi:hypothetical protein